MKGKEPKLVLDERPRDSNVVNLMERLRASLDAAGGKSKARAKKRGRHAA
jgi:non-homologous end joining protein Ku